MTSYHGGKQKIGRKISNIIFDKSSKIDFEINGYCEPFCGMLGVYKNIPNKFSYDICYKAGDYNKSVIEMWKSAQSGWEPPKQEVSYDEFMSLAGNGESSAEKGYIGHLYGYYGKYFKPFDNKTTLSQRVNTSNRVMGIANELSDTTFSHGSYTQFSDLKNYVIYCDPPYRKQNGYYDEYDNKRHFNHEEFWDWCVKMSNNGNIVFISEYDVPKNIDVETILVQGNEYLFKIC